MLTTIATLALLLQAAPTPPTPPTLAARPKVKVHAPEAPRWSSRRDRDEASEQTRDTTFAVRQGQRLEVDNFGGSITVTAWNQDRVRIAAAAGGDGFEVEGRSITIQVSSSARRHGGPGEAALTIQVPAWMELELSGNEVEISTRGMRAPVQASSVEGSITIDGGEGGIEVHSVEGDLTISNVNGRLS